MAASPHVDLYPEKLTYGWTSFREAGHQGHIFDYVYSIARLPAESKTATKMLLDERLIHEGAPSSQY